MKTLEALAAQGMGAFALIILVILGAAYIIGTRLAHWRQDSKEATVEATGFVTNGMLGLLAFTLGLTIAMAQGRFEDRRVASLAEANAIGTAWLRASSMEHPRAAEVARLLEAYTRVRIAFVETGPSLAEISGLNAETTRLQNIIWGHVSAITRERADPLTAALQASLNDVFDEATAQRWAFAAPLPAELVLLLMAMATISIGLVGHQFGLKRNGEPALAVLLVAVWTAALIVVVDLSTPRFGAVRADARAYEWTLQGFQGGVVIPPPP